MAEIKTTFAETLESLLEMKRFNSARDVLVTMNPADAAALLEKLEPHQLPLAFRLLPKDHAAEVFVEMDSSLQEALIAGFSDAELKTIVDDLSMDDAADLAEEMPAGVVKRILSQAEPEARRLINELLCYPKDSAGSIMTTEFVDLRPDMTAGEAIDHIRRTGVDKETVNTCYVTDAGRKLLGAVSIRHLILAEENTPVRLLMEPNVITAETREDQEEVARRFGKYDFSVLPVVDGEGRLVGIVTVDDAMDVLEEETSADISMMAAVTPADRPYLRLRVWELWKSRIPWLLLLMISATFTGLIIAHFEDALAAYIVLTGAIPMLMDTGGNAGSQSSATVIRGLSLGEIRPRDVLPVLWKEFRVALLCGVTLGGLNFCRLLVLDHVAVPVAAVICLTLVCTVLVAKLVGGVLPLGAQAVGIDPVVMASPFITTIVDTLSLLIYFTLATAILGI